MEVCKRCGGSKQSGYVQRLISEGKLDPSKVSSPSKFIQAMKGKTTEPVSRENIDYIIKRGKKGAIKGYIPIPNAEEQKIMDSLEKKREHLDKKIEVGEERQKLIKEFNSLTKSTNKRISDRVRQITREDEKNGFFGTKKESPKVEPKVEPKPEPKPEPKDLNKPATIIQSKFREFLNSRKKMDLFYSKLNDFLTARGSTKAYNKFLKENPEFDREFVNSLVGTQKGMDFYPTPETCLAYEEIIYYIKKAKNILEPTAGLGSMVHFISKHKKPSAKVTVNELNTTFIEPLKKFFPKFTITQENFLEQDVKNSYDLIICNPPFSIGKDKKAYLDFLLKCCYMLNTSSAKGEKCLIFICPEIIKKESDWKEGEYNGFDFRSILSGIQFERVNKMYKELTNESLNKKEFQEYKDGESYFEVELFEPQQSEWLGSCIGFGGTGVKTGIYRFIFV